MIKSKEALSMAEAAKYLGKESVPGAEVGSFTKKFVKIKPAEAESLRSKLEGLSMMKMRAEHITKIIDLLPEDPETLNKIFIDVGLDEDEKNKILEIVKEFK